MLRRALVKLKSGTEYLNYGRDIIRNWGAELAVNGDGPFRVLDIGCGHGTDLTNIASSIAAHPAVQAGRSVELVGVENYSEYVAECRALGIKIHSVDIERDRFPEPDASFDLILANQVLEHTKEIFWITSEVGRLLKPGGHFITGVPNLASLHNRLLLLFGIQPTAQLSLSAHVRSFTRGDLVRFMTAGGFFEPRAFGGSNFYPFPAFLARPLAWLFPGMAWGLFGLFRRTEQSGSFLECLHKADSNLMETPFYGSPQNPVRAAQRAPARKTKTGKQATKKVARRPARNSRK